MSGTEDTRPEDTIPEEPPPEDPQEATSPGGSEWGALTGAAVTAEQIAGSWEMPPNEILDLARRGVFPRDVADWSHAERRWGFSADTRVTPQLVKSAADKDKLYLRGVPSHACDGTAKWLQSQETTGSGASREILVEWCAAAEPSPMSAPRSALVEWCTHRASTPRDVADRWVTLSGWYDLLTESGYEHASPHEGTRVCVAADTWDDWPGVTE